MRFLSGGESHGSALIGIIEGLPAGLELSAEAINRQLARRQHGYGRGGRMAIENDQVEFSGLRFGCLGGPDLASEPRRENWRPWRRKVPTGAGRDCAPPAAGLAGR